MIIKLDSGVVINTNYITAIEPLEEGSQYQYDVYMVDHREWYASQKDYIKIIKYSC